MELFDSLGNVRKKNEQQVTADRVEASPPPRVDAPLEALDHIWLVATLAVESDHLCLDVGISAVFTVDIAVAT